MPLSDLDREAVQWWACQVARFSLFRNRGRKRFRRSADTEARRYAWAAHYNRVVPYCRRYRNLILEQPEHRPEIIRVWRRAYRSMLEHLQETMGPPRKRIDGRLHWLA